MIILTFKDAEWCFLAESQGFFCSVLVRFFSLNSFSSEAGERRGRRKGEKENVWRRTVQGISYRKIKSVKDNLTEVQLPINVTVAVKTSIRLKQL